MKTWRSIPMVLTTIILLAATAWGVLTKPNAATDVKVYFYATDPNGEPNTSPVLTDYDIYYVEEGAAMSAKVDLTALAAADTAHTDNKGYHVGQGSIRVDFPDAAFDGGVGKTVELILVDVTGSPKDVIFPITVQLGAVVDVRAWNGTAIPAVYTAGYPIATIKDGTGTGELDTASGVVQSNMVQVNGSTNGIANWVKLFYSHWATVFDDGNDVLNSRDVALSKSVPLATLTGGSTIQVDASGYAKTSVGTGIGQLNITSGVVDGKVVAGNDNVVLDVNTADFFAVNSGKTYATSVAGSVVKETADNAAGATLTLNQIADAVHDEARAGHTTPGTFGEGVASVQGNVTGSVASVTGAVGSVTGAVASVTAGVTLADNAITNAKIATDAFGADELAASGAAEIATASWANAQRTLTALDEDTTALDLDSTKVAATVVWDPDDAQDVADAVVNTILSGSGTPGSLKWYIKQIWSRSWK